MKSLIEDYLLNSDSEDELATSHLGAKHYEYDHRRLLMFNSVPDRKSRDIKYCYDTVITEDIDEKFKKYWKFGNLMCIIKSVLISKLAVQSHS